MDDKFVSRFRFAEGEEATLDAVAVIYAQGQSACLKSLLVGLERDLGRFRKEMNLDLSVQGAWNAYDYLGILYLRDTLESTVEALDDERRHVGRNALRVVDEILKEITEPDESGMLSQMDGSGPSGKGWWWSRVLVRGPVREDVEDYRRFMGNEPP